MSLGARSRQRLRDRSHRQIAPPRTKSGSRSSGAATVTPPGPHGLRASRNRARCPVAGRPASACAPARVTGATRRSSPQRYSRAEVQTSRIVGIVEGQRAHQRQALHVRLPGQRVGVRHQAVAQLEKSPADRLDRPSPYAHGRCRARSGRGAEDRSRRRRTGTSGRKARPLRRDRVEAADIGTPERHARQTDIEAEADLRLERRPRCC